MAFVAGQKIRASELNEIDAGPIFCGTAGGNTTLPSGAFTSVALSTEVIDTHNGHSTSVNNSRWTCPSGWAGYYEITGGVYVQGGTGGTYRACRVAVNGTGLGRSQGNITALNETSVNMIPTVVLLAVGDYVEMQVGHNAGSNRNTLADQTALSVKFLRP